MGRVSTPSYRLFVVSSQSGEGRELLLGASTPETNKSCWFPKCYSRSFDGWIVIFVQLAYQVCGQPGRVKWSTCKHIIATTIEIASYLLFIPRAVVLKWLSYSSSPDPHNYLTRRQEAGIARSSAGSQGASE